MRVRVSFAQEGRMYAKLVDLENMNEAGKEISQLVPGEHFVFRMSEYDDLKHKEKDNGKGNEASWWAVHFGSLDQILAVVKRDRGDFPRHDRELLMPFLTQESYPCDSRMESCCVYCIPKPRVEHSGRFTGPDRQPWAEKETVCQIIRYTFHIPDEVPIFIIG